MMNVAGAAPNKTVMANASESGATAVRLCRNPLPRRRCATGGLMEPGARTVLNRLRRRKASCGHQHGRAW
jgi:hypothetical protein